MNIADKIYKTRQDLSVSRFYILLKNHIGKNSPGKIPGIPPLVTMALNYDLFFKGFEVGILSGKASLR